MASLEVDVSFGKQPTNPGCKKCHHYIFNDLPRGVPLPEDWIVHVCLLPENREPAYSFLSGTVLKLGDCGALNGYGECKHFKHKPERATRPWWQFWGCS